MTIQILNGAEERDPVADGEEDWEAVLTFHQSSHSCSQLNSRRSVASLTCQTKLVLSLKSSDTQEHNHKHTQIQTQNRQAGRHVKSDIQ